MDDRYLDKFFKKNLAEYHDPEFDEDAWVNLVDRMAGASLASGAWRMGAYAKWTWVAALALLVLSNVFWMIRADRQHQNMQEISREMESIPTQEASVRIDTVYIHLPSTPHTQPATQQQNYVLHAAGTAQVLLTSEQHDVRILESDLLKHKGIPNIKRLLQQEQISLATDNITVENPAIPFIIPAHIEAPKNLFTPGLRLGYTRALSKGHTDLGAGGINKWEGGLIEWNPKPWLGLISGISIGQMSYANGWEQVNDYPYDKLGEFPQLVLPDPVTNLDKVGMRASVLTIPLAARIYLRPRKNLRPYIQAGIRPRLFLKQTFIYQYHFANFEYKTEVEHAEKQVYLINPEFSIGADYAFSPRMQGAFGLLFQQKSAPQGIENRSYYFVGLEGSIWLKTK